MHKMRFTEPEEDDGFFVYTIVTEAIYLLFPYVQALWGAGFADDLPPRQRRRLMRYYRSCLQRHLYLNGSDKILLSKATQLSGSILSLRQEFPDTRIINILRNPVESIPSHISVFYTVWQWLDLPSGRMARNRGNMPNSPPHGFSIWRNMTSHPKRIPTSGFPTKTSFTTQRKRPNRSIGILASPSAQMPPARFHPMPAGHWTTKAPIGTPCRNMAFLRNG